MSKEQILKPTLIGVIYAKDRTKFLTHGAKLILKDGKGLYIMSAGIRVDLELDALKLMLEKGMCELFD